MSTRAPKKEARSIVPAVHSRPGPEGGRRDLNRKQRLESLLGAALPLFLERGIEGVTIDDIVAAAATAKGSYYRYFDDKAGLVRALLTPVREKIEEAFARCEQALAAAKTPPLLSAAYVGLAMGLSEIFMESPGVVRLYLQEARGPAVPARAPVVELARAVFEASVRLTKVAHARNLLRPMDPRVSALAVVGAAECLLLATLSGETLGDPELVIHALVTLVLDGLRATS